MFAFICRKIFRQQVLLSYYKFPSLDNLIRMIIRYELRNWSNAEDIRNW